jgi:hypothetical protein
MCSRKGVRTATINAVAITVNATPTTPLPPKTNDLMNQSYASESTLPGADLLAWSPRVLRESRCREVEEFGGLVACLRAHLGTLPR